MPCVAVDRSCVVWVGQGVCNDLCLVWLLTDRASSGSGKVSEWIAEIHEWLQPMTKASLSVTPEHLEELIQQLRTHNDDILDIPKGLATVLRIMHHLAVPPPTHSKEGRALLLTSLKDSPRCSG